MNRTINLFLGLLGSMFGIFGSIYSVYLKDFEGQTQTINPVETIILYSILAATGSFISFFNPRIGGWLMIVSAAALGFTILYTGSLGIISIILLVISALNSFRHNPKIKRKKKTITSKSNRKSNTNRSSRSNKSNKKAI